MNDWLVANINNPDFTVSDFKNIADMSIDNTQFLKKDQTFAIQYVQNSQQTLTIMFIKHVRIWKMK